MIKRDLRIIGLLTALASLSGCASIDQEKLTVLDGQRLTYQCEGGSQIEARYYSLSDDSLDFVKVFLPNGKGYTLPHVLSGSGVRYSDDFELVWWTKGNTAFAETRNEQGDWQIKYRNCHTIGSVQ